METSEEDEMSDESESSSSSEIKMPLHVVGEIVWAKVRGHAWWPAKIGKICDFGNEAVLGAKSKNDIKYVLHFIGDKSRSQLSQRSTRKFEFAFLKLAFITR